MQLLSYHLNSLPKNQNRPHRLIKVFIRTGHVFKNLEKDIDVLNHRIIFLKILVKNLWSNAYSSIKQATSFKQSWKWILKN